MWRTWQSSDLAEGNNTYYSPPFAAAWCCLAFQHEWLDLWTDHRTFGSFGLGDCTRRHVWHRSVQPLYVFERPFLLGVCGRWIIYIYTVYKYTYIILLFLCSWCPRWASCRLLLLISLSNNDAHGYEVLCSLEMLQGFSSKGSHSVQPGGLASTNRTNTSSKRESRESCSVGHRGKCPIHSGNSNEYNII